MSIEFFFNHFYKTTYDINCSRSHEDIIETNCVRFTLLFGAEKGTVQRDAYSTVKPRGAQAQKWDI